MSSGLRKLELRGDSNKESTVSDYFSLFKPRVMSLAVFTSICGLYLAPGNLHPFLSALVF